MSDEFSSLAFCLFLLPHLFKTIHFHLTSRSQCNFVRVTLTGDGNPPTAEILSKQRLKLPVKHLLFKIQEQPSKRTTESMLLLKRIECQSGGWSIEDQTAGQKVLFRKRDQVCEDDVYLMHYAQIEEVGQMGRQEVPMQVKFIFMYKNNCCMHLQPKWKCQMGE